MKKLTHFALPVCLLLSSSAVAEESGTVQVPLEVYRQLVENTQAKVDEAPAGFAVSEANVVLKVDESGAGVVEANVVVRILESRWTLVPLLPPGTAMLSAKVGGAQTQLVPSAAGLAFVAKTEGTHALQLTYAVDVQSSGAGKVIPLPLVAAPSTVLEAQVPGVDLEMAVVPAATYQTRTVDGQTRLTATLPAAAAAQISWRTISRAGFAVSRAHYRGALSGQAIGWTVSFDVELFGGEAEVPLLPAGTTMSSLAVDGRPGTILTGKAGFATLVRGRGRHRIDVSFESPVDRAEGPPRAQLSMLKVPINRFDLTLPGKKELAVEPTANVRARYAKGQTTATINAPMVEALTLSWSEAVPEEIEEQIRANASIYHAAHAEEGVVHVRASIAYEVTRGATSVVRFFAPADVQINKIAADNGAVSDWRAVKSGKRKEVTVFLDRKLNQDARFDVRYERLTSLDMVRVPLLRMADVHRQRGMVTLLSSDELSLKPAEQQGLSKVGENQLPGSFRGELEMQVAHTFKYADADAAQLSVQAVAPERRQAKFDGEVDTLISLSDVTMKGSATVRINVKSGKMDVLRLELPKDVTLLNVTAPSKRTHSVKVEGDTQQIDLHFTQEMEGEFPVDLDYERIISAEDEASTVPVVKVVGAEPEQGRIAVEALTAVEVRSKSKEGLSLVDVSELPKQLVLKTRNPIRLAYKYVQAGHRLALEITRHQELETQIATIERAHYKTLFTRDGLAVTTASFTVKNSRKQFLQICMPKETEIWSVFVDGKAEKPALDAKQEQQCDGLGVLVKVINSAQGFPVELVYRSKVDRIGGLGKVQAALPRPDMVVTHSRWDVFLPDRLRYLKPTSNMDVVVSGQSVGRNELSTQLASEGQPLRVAVPMTGVQFSFEKLYANQAEEGATIAIPYRSGEGEGWAGLLATLGALLFGAGAFFCWRPQLGIRRRTFGGAAAVGLSLIGVGLFLGAAFPTWTLLMLLGLLGATLLYPRVRTMAVTG